MAMAWTIEIFQGIDKAIVVPLSFYLGGTSVGYLFARSWFCLTAAHLALTSTLSRNSPEAVVSIYLHAILPFIVLPSPPPCSCFLRAPTHVPFFHPFPLSDEHWNNVEIFSLIAGVVGLWAVFGSNATAAKLYLWTWAPRFLLAVATTFSVVPEMLIVPFGAMNLLLLLYYCKVRILRPSTVYASLPLDVPRHHGFALQAEHRR